MQYPPDHGLPLVQLKDAAAKWWSLSKTAVVKLATMS